MIRLKSASYDPVVIPELEDTIYYNQEKSYTESQYATAPTLRTEIRKGRLVVLERTGDSNASNPAPAPQSNTKPEPVRAPIERPTPQPKPSVGDDSEYKDLLEQINNLTSAVTSLKEKNDSLTAEPITKETIIEKAPEQDPQVLAMMQAMMEKMTDLSSQVEESKKANPSSSSNASLEKGLADISKKISGLSISGPGVQGQPNIDNNRDPNSIYIPSIKVDDLSNNVKLESKNLGQGGKVNDALAALNKLKKKPDNK